MDASRIRRTIAGIILAGLAVAGPGFTHLVRPDPGWAGGIGQPAVAVQADGDPGGSYFA